MVVHLHGKRELGASSSSLGKKFSLKIRIVEPVKVLYLIIIFHPVMIKNVLKRRRECGTYLATARRYRRRLKMKKKDE